MTSRIERAHDFLLQHARLLERQLFAALFAAAAPDGAVRALLAYQNADGGFGNALEPDKRVPSSQPVDVQVAFEWLDALDQFDVPCVVEAVDWLQSISLPGAGVPFATAAVLDYPRAPWWNVSAEPEPSLNPTAALVGLLLKHGVQHPWVEQASAWCWQALAAFDGSDFHTVMCAVEFLRHTPDQARAKPLLDALGQRILAAGEVNFDPQAGGYLKGPLDWAPSPAHPFHALFSAEQIAAASAALQRQQQPDGGWPINWQPITAAVEYEWRGAVTIQALLKLRAYQAL